MTAQQQSLVTENIKLAHFAAHKWPIYGIEYDDLLQIASVGLCKAAMTYSKEKSKFSTYGLFCARNELLMAARKQGHQLQCVSLDMEMQDTDGSPTPLGAFIPSKLNIESEVAANDALRSIRMSPIERDVVNLRLAGLSQRECSMVIGYSQGWISRILKKVSQKLNYGPA
jgi:RNA polymerase sigma factor (sigma-70 family)